MLKGVAGFMRQVSGEIRLNGKAIHGPGPDRMMVFQEFDQLLPWKTVKQNIMFPMLTSGKRSEEHTSELQSLMRISYAVFCLQKKKNTNIQIPVDYVQVNMTAQSTI